MSNSCIEHYLALIGACMPTLGPFFRWLRPSHWKQGNPDHRRYHDTEAFQPAWPKTHKTSSTDDSLMNGSMNLATPAGHDFNSIYGMHSQSLPHRSQESLDSAWVKSDVYGNPKSSATTKVTEKQQAEENPKQTFRNNVELVGLKTMTNAAEAGRR